MIVAILYLTEQQAWVGKEGECLVVHIPERTEQQNATKRKARKMTVPLCKIEERAAASPYPSSRGKAALCLLSKG